MDRTNYIRPKKLSSQACKTNWWADRHSTQVYTIFNGTALKAQHQKIARHLDMYILPTWIQQRRICGYSACMISGWSVGTLHPTVMYKGFSLHRASNGTVIVDTQTFEMCRYYSYTYLQRRWCECVRTLVPSSAGMGRMSLMEASVCLAGSIYTHCRPGQQEQLDINV